MSQPFFKASDFDPGIGPADDGQNLCTYAWAARVANRLLQERGTVVYGESIGGRLHFFSDKEKAGADTHRALLINIEPIEKDSAEKIVNDLACFALGGNVEARSIHSLCSLADRARKLRGEK